MPVISGGGGGNGGSQPFPLAAGIGVPGFDFADTYSDGTLYFEQSFGGIYLRTTHDYDVSAAVSDPSVLPNLGITRWVRVGGDNNGWPVPGAEVGGNGAPALSARPGRSSGLSDLVAFAGSGNGLFWNYNNATTDGAQELWVQIGAGGAKAWLISGANGTLGPPPGGIVFPSADPNIAGAWWDDVGTLTKSTG